MGRGRPKKEMLLGTAGERKPTGRRPQEHRGLSFAPTHTAYAAIITNSAEGCGRPFTSTLSYHFRLIIRQAIMAVFGGRLALIGAHA